VRANSRYIYDAAEVYNTTTKDGKDMMQWFGTNMP